MLLLASFLASSSLVTSLGPCLGSRIMDPRELKAQMGELDTNCISSSFHEGVTKMADIDTDPFRNHDKTDVQPDHDRIPISLLERSSFRRSVQYCTIESWGDTHERSVFLKSINELLNH